jgi:hypothetical protein
MNGEIWDQNWALSEALAEFAQFPKFRVPQMLTAKRAGARLGYPTPLQQRAVPVQRDKAAERQDNRITTD